MSLINRIQNRLVTGYHRTQFNRVARGILKTNALRPGGLPFLALSMVQHRDVVPYLVAIKSFAHHVPPARVVVVCDPSITNDDRATFKRHIPHAELRNAVEFRNPEIPIGGCWERLAAITSYSSSQYVVQLDADTVTISPLPEVLAGVKACTGFVLGEEKDQKIMTLLETANNAKSWSDHHIQAVAEKSMALALQKDALYIRGCAGFTGFPRNDNLREELSHFSRSMWGHIGSRWTEWGTEQVASNFLVANSPDTQILPFPKYSTPPKDQHDVAFHHYIGHVRFGDSRYANAAELSIRKLAP